MHLILLRHAAALGQAPEANLSDAGYQQAEKLAVYLTQQPIDAVFSSPYKRAVETIAPFAQQTGLKIHTLDHLRERTLSAIPRDDWLEHVELSFQNRDYKLPGGESLHMTTQRALTAIETIKASGVLLSVAVSHGNLIASLLRHIDPDFGFPDWQAMQNPAGYEVSFHDGQPRQFRELNVT